MEIALCEETVIEVHVAKNRNAGLGVCELAFYKDKSLVTCSEVVERVESRPTEN